MVGNVQYAEFRLDEIFDISRGIRVTKANQEPGDIPYVTAFTSNNGIDSYIDNPPFIQNTILTASFLGDVFYHPYDVSYKDGTYGLKFKEGIVESDRLYLYFAPMIEKIAKSTASYSQNMLLKDYESMILQLPTTPSGQPDFDYMENYIKEIEHKHIKKLESDLVTRTEKLLTVIGREDLVGDPDGLAAVVDKGFNDSGVDYAEFRVGDIFNIVTGALLPKDLLVDEGRNAATLARASASSQNNGVTMYLPLDLEHKNYRVFKNTVSVSFLGDVFYQEKASFDMKVHGLQHENLTRNSGLYIAGALRKLIDGRYSYGNQLSSSKLPELVLTLPTTVTGQPDFDFMEQYIAHIELKYTHIDAMVESERIAITKELVE